MARLTESQRETFEALRRTYLAEVPARIAAIREAATEAGGRGASHLEDLRHLAHQLVGSSAIFGLSGLSDVARALEDHLIRLLGGVPDAGELEELVASIEHAWRETATPSSRDPER